MTSRVKRFEFIRRTTVRDTVSLNDNFLFVLDKQIGAYQRENHQKEGTQAVSYTHLDVYKRQELATTLT